MAEFKIYIDAVRTNTGMNQDEWASKLGVSTTTVKNWEAGKTKPDLDQVRIMSEISKIPMDYIFLPSSPTISE